MIYKLFYYLYQSAVRNDKSVRLRNVRLEYNVLIHAY